MKLTTMTSTKTQAQTRDPKMMMKMALETVVQVRRERPSPPKADPYQRNPRLARAGSRRNEQCLSGHGSTVSGDRGRNGCSDPDFGRDRVGKEVVMTAISTSRARAFFLLDPSKACLFMMVSSSSCQSEYRLSCSF